MNKEIYAFENCKIKPCEESEKNNFVCSCIQGGICYCSKKYYQELKELCKKKKFEFLKADNDVIKCTGYTGYFQLSDEVGVHVLPKIDKEDVENGKEIFLNLLNAASRINNIKLGNTTFTKLDKERTSIEIQIKLFCAYMDVLFKKGLKKFYSPEEDNLPYLKGKIKFSEHIKRNIVSKEKFYVEYDEFTEDIPENRILRTACNYLIKLLGSLTPVTGEKQAARTETIKKLKRYIQEFGCIEDSKNLIKDFSGLQQNKLYEHYDKPLQFAKVFLSHKNYWIEKGRTKFPSILYSLHGLFEDYIQNLLDEYQKKINFKYKSQFKTKDKIWNYLLPEAKLFTTKMDFVLWNKDESKYIILDAKYKLINMKSVLEEAEKEDEEKDSETIYKSNMTHINPPDLYQVFTYAELIKNNYKYGDNKSKTPNVEIALLYPKTKNFEEVKTFRFFNGTAISFIPIDLTGDAPDNNPIFEYFIKSRIKKYFYIHGLMATGQTSAKELSRVLDTDVTVLSWDYTKPFDENFKNLSDILKKEKDFILIGSSMGGFYANALANKFKVPCVLFNPATNPQKVFENVKNSDFYKDGSGNFTKELVNSYKNQENVELPRLVVIGKNDDIVNPDDNIKYWKGIKNCTLKTVEEGHQIENFDALKNDILDFENNILS